MDLIESQLRAARNGLEAAAIAIEVAMDAYGGLSASEAPTGDQPGAIVDCDHPNKEDASVMGGDPKWYCRDCRHFVFPGGRTERADNHATDH